MAAFATGDGLRFEAQPRPPSVRAAPEQQFWKARIDAIEPASRATSRRLAPERHGPSPLAHHHPAAARSAEPFGDGGRRKLTSPPVSLAHALAAQPETHTHGVRPSPRGALRGCERAALDAPAAHARGSGGVWAAAHRRPGHAELHAPPRSPASARRDDQLARTFGAHDDQLDRHHERHVASEETFRAAKATRHREYAAARGRPEPGGAGAPSPSPTSLASHAPAATYGVAARTYEQRVAAENRAMAAAARENQRAATRDHLSEEQAHVQHVDGGFLNARQTMI